MQNQGVILLFIYFENKDMMKVIFYFWPRGGGGGCGVVVGGGGVGDVLRLLGFSYLVPIFLLTGQECSAFLFSGCPT